MVYLKETRGQMMLRTLGAEPHLLLRASAAQPRLSLPEIRWPGFPQWIANELACTMVIWPLGITMAARPHKYRKYELTGASARHELEASKLRYGQRGIAGHKSVALD